MLKIRTLLICMLLAAEAQAAAPAAAPAKAPPTSSTTSPRLAEHEKPLPGLWQDIQNPENIIRFLPDHRVQVFVSRKDGLQLKQRWINGTWELTPALQLTLKLQMTSGDGTILTTDRVFNIAFKKREMVVKSGNAVLGRQHRITEAVLNKYLW